MLQVIPLCLSLFPVDLYPTHCQTKAKKPKNKSNLKKRWQEEKRVDCWGQMAGALVTKTAHLARVRVRVTKVKTALRSMVKTSVNSRPKHNLWTFLIVLCSDPERKSADFVLFQIVSSELQLSSATLLWELKPQFVPH